MRRRHEVTDAEWARLQPLLPARKPGTPRKDDRLVINAILWKLTTGAPWRDLPARYGPWQTCYDRFVRWRRDGTWDRLLAHVQTKSDAVGEVVWEVSLDSTHVRAHQHAAGARQQPSQADAKRGSTTRPTKRLGAAAAGFPP